MTSAPPDLAAYQAILFDLDGVLTPTSDLHKRAWQQMFDDFLATRDGQEPYTEQDYFDHVDGKPRYDGVRDLLASRKIELPDGDPGDPVDQAEGEETVCGLGNRKNEQFNEVLERDGIAAYPGSRRLLDALAERGTKMGVVSSSANAPQVLDIAGIAEFFGVVIHGGLPEVKAMKGKPAPDTYLAAAERLGVAAEHAVVMEDATSGVAAGRAGHFGLVVGVDRGAGHAALERNGADVVVDDLADLLAGLRPDQRTDQPTGPGTEQA